MDIRQLRQDLQRLVCYAVGHRWEVTAIHGTHGRAECDRCGRETWEQN